MNSAQFYYQDNSKNYGLERLAYDLHQSQKSEEKPTSASKFQLAEMQILERMITFNKHDFHYKWSLLIFIANIYNFFTVPYYLGIEGFPSNVWLCAELFFEFILLLDLFGRLIFKQYMKSKDMWLLAEKESTCVYIFLGLSSIPYSFISYLLIKDLALLPIALSRCGKMLRYFQLATFFNNLEIIRKEGIQYIIELFKLLMLLLASVHYLGCIWLLVARIERISDYSYWDEEWIINHAEDWELYIDSCFWAAESLTGIIIEESLEYTLTETVICIIVMLIGAFIYAIIFGRLAAILANENSHKVLNAEKLETAVMWGKQRKLSQALQRRVKIYYKIACSRFLNQINYSFIDDLPLSLKTEVSLLMYKDLLPKVKLFEMGDPGFMMATVRHLKPRLYMMGDYIIRKGDYPIEFFILRVGTAEVLAVDGVTQISLLDEGSYFGEIGILFNTYRTVPVRAASACIVCYIHKDNFLEIMKAFPEHLQFLTKVAFQRMQCHDVSDFDTTYDLLEDSSSSDESDDEKDLEPPMFYTEREHYKKSWVKKFLTVPASCAPREYLNVDPLSSFFYVWAGVVGAAYVFYLAYVPFAICFESDGSVALEALNWICYFVFVFDIVVVNYTSILTEFGTYVHGKDEIHKNYIRKYLLTDLLTLFPTDFVFIYIQAPQYMSAYVRIMRLFKYSRVSMMVKMVIKQHSRYHSLIRLSFIMFLFFYFTHLFGCIFLYIAKIQYYYFSTSRFDNKVFITSYNPDILTLSVSDQYITMIYFGTSVISIAAYGDIYPVAGLEKLFCLFWVLFSRLLVAFLYAESSNLMSSLNQAYIRHLIKVKIVKQWISHIQMPKPLQLRVLNYYDLLWRKLNGCNDEEVLNDLPEALRTDIQYFLFNGLTKSGLFPEDDHGAILSIVRRCRVQVYCAGEIIIAEGELGLEMFFIMEGSVKVTTSLNVVLNRLVPGNFFGEISLIKPVPDVRLATIVAETDVTLAVLSLQDYKYISTIFPNFSEEVSKKAAEREIMNRATFVFENLEVIREYQKFTDRADMDSPELQTVSFVEKSLPVVEVKNEQFMVKAFNSKIKRLPYLLVWVWNILFVPYKVAFKEPYGNRFLCFEIISIVTYAWFGYYYLRLTLSSNPLLFQQEKFLKFKSFYHFLLCIPFLLISDYADVKHSTIAMFALLRISNVYLVFTVFTKLKQNINWFTFISILQILTTYLLINHILGCYFIFVGKSFDIDNSWLTPYKDLSNYSLYLYGFYWANSTLSHSTVGDVFSINSSEKLFNSITFLISCFLYALLFGSLSSLFTGFASQLKTNLQESYIYVKNFVKKKKVEKVFSSLIEDYYNYIWYSNKGIIDSKILNELPHTLRISIQIFRYSNAIKASHIFKDSQGEIDYNVTQSVFRVMSIQFYLVGDSIIKVGDKNYDMYILLEGEVDVMDLKGRKVLATLNEGSHFGEANFILKNEMRTATITATKISRIGILSHKDLEILFEAFPAWYEMLANIVKSRMKQTFNTTKAEDVSKQVQSISSKLQKTPGSYKKYTKRSEKLLSSKIATIIAHASSGKWMTLNFVHFSLIIYSLISIPILIGFDVQANFSIIFIEVLVILESFVYFAINLKATLAQIFKSELNSHEKLKICYKNFLLEDFLSFSPMNLLFMIVSDTEALYEVPLRLIRITAVLRIPSLLEKIELYDRNLVRAVNFFRILLAAVLLVHWSSCGWASVSRSDSGWASVYGFTDVRLSVFYENSLYYVLNIISGTGYNNTKPILDNERVYTVFLSLLGFALFASSFGLMASISQLKVTKLQEMLQNIKAPFNIINKLEVPYTLTNRLEQYYAFSTGLSQALGPINFKTLYSHLPPNIVGTIIYECNKSMLKKLPFLAQTESSEVIERISLCLIPQIYLPNDYIIYKNDIGEEMFFIILGSVDILGPDNYKTVKSLSKGEFFGEMALLTDSRRMCSVQSNGLSLIYSLNKSDFLKLLQDFPDLVKIIQDEVRRRNLESSSIKNEPIKIENQDFAQKYFLETLDMYSSMSNPFFKNSQSPKRLSLLVGMKNYDSEVIKESYNQKRSQGLHKRRPPVENSGERRMSQEYVGKSVVLSKFAKLRPDFGN